VRIRAFGNEIPACFSFIGNGEIGKTGGVPLHSKDYNFNDEIIPSGVDFYVEVAKLFLANE